VSTRRYGLGKVTAGLAVTGLIGSAAIVAGTQAAAATASLPVLPAYQVQGSGLTTAQAAALKQAFGLPSIEYSVDGSVRFSDEAKFMRVPTIDRGAGGVDEDGNTTRASELDLAAVRALTPISRETALARTATALRAAGLTPTGARATADHTTLEVVDTKGGQLASAALDTTVSYSFTLGGLPLHGPGAKIRVAYDGSGAVTQLSYSTRRLVQSGGVTVVDMADAVQRCRTAMRTAATVRASYAYEAPKLSHAVSRIEPSLRCEGFTGDGDALQVRFVPAAASAQLPTPVIPPATRSLTTGVAPQSSPSTQTNVISVGSEGTGECSGLPHTGLNLDSFNDEFSGRGIPVDFSWLDANAWERDWKDAAFGGTDSSWTDDVDMAYWQGHGTPTGFMFDGCSNINDDFMSNDDARWGNKDVEWISLFTCNILKGSSGGEAWWERWGDAFHGVHQINSFATVSYHSSDHGTQYGEYLLRNNPKTVKNAWAWASIDDQGSDVKFASMGPVSAAGMVTVDDYFWNKGAVGPDVPHNQLTAWWYLVGNS
jgi:hypothetical protein